MADYEPGAPLPGMVIAILSLFDTDGSGVLSEAEWLKGNAALELDTSSEEFQLLRDRFDESKGAEDELNFAKAMGIFGSRKPVEGYIEDILRRLMRAIVSLTSKVSTIQQVLDRTVLREENERNHRISKILRQWKHQHTSRAFDGWRDLTRRNFALRDRIGGHWRNALVASVWRRWVEMVGDVREQREAVTRAVGRWRNRFVAAAFTLWRDDVRAAVDDRRAKLAKAVSRMSNQALSLTFEAWALLRSRAHEVRELQRRALVRMTHRLVGEVFWAWAETAAEEATLRSALLRRCGARMLKRNVVLTFEAWRDLAAAQADGREQQYARALGRFRNRLTSMVFEVWLNFVAWRRRIFSRAAYALGPGRSLWTAWRTWVETARAMKQAEQREWIMSVLGDSMPQLVATALREAMPAVFGGDVYEELQRLRASMMTAEEREARERNHRISKILRQWKHQHTSRAFDGWRDLTRDSRALRERVGRHWRNALVASVWRRWVEMVGDVREQREAVTRAVGRWRNRFVAAAFTLWRDDVRAAVDDRRAKLAKAVSRMSNQALSLTFEAWALLRSRAHEVRELQRRALVRMTHRLVGEVFWAWAEAAVEERERRGILRARVGARMLKRNVVLTFEAWRDLAAAQADGREQQYARALGRFRNRLTSMVFEVWLNFVAWRRRIFSRAAYALGPGRSLWTAWRTWVETARAMKQAEQREWIMSVLGDSKTWLLEALGDVLPSLLPDTSALFSSMTTELEGISSRQARIQQHLAEHDELLEPSPAAVSAAAQASLTERLHQQVNESRRMTSESHTHACVAAVSGLQAVDDLLGAQRSTSDKLGGVKQELTRLVDEKHSEAGARLLALARAQEAQRVRWDSASERVERELMEVRTMSADTGERLQREMASMRRFVVDQTRSYLAAAAVTSADKQALEEELVATREDNMVLADRLRALEVGLESAAPVSALAGLSEQLQRLHAAKAGREEVHDLLDQVQRPAVVVSGVGGGGSTLVSGADLKHASPRATSPTPPAQVAGGRARPRSACAALRIVPGSDFSCRGKDGALYRGQAPPTLGGGSCSARGAGALYGSSTAGAPPSGDAMATVHTAIAEGDAPLAPNIRLDGGPADCAVGVGPTGAVTVSGTRIGGPPPGARGFMPKPPGRPLQTRPQRAYENLLERPACAFTASSPRAVAVSTAPPASRQQRPRSATSERAAAPAHKVAAALGPGYAACREGLVALESELQERRETIEFVFAPLAQASGRGERTMWLQWIQSAGGSGWAFYEPDVSLTPSAVATRTAIATQRASLAEFLTQVEGRYLGYTDLVRVNYAEATLWSRHMALAVSSCSSSARGAPSEQPAAGPVAPAADEESRPPRPASGLSQDDLAPWVRPSTPESP